MKYHWILVASLEVTTGYSASLEIPRILALDLQTGFRFSGTLESSFKDGDNLTLELADGKRIQAPMHLRPASHRGSQHHVDSAVVTGSEHVRLDHHAMHRGGQEHGQGGGSEHVRLDHHAMHRGGQEHGQGEGSEHVRLDHHAMHKGGQEHGQGGGSEHVRLDHDAMHVECNNARMQHKRGAADTGADGSKSNQSEIHLLSLTHHYHHCDLKVQLQSAACRQEQMAAADTGAENCTKRQRSKSPVKPRSALFHLENSISPAQLILFHRSIDGTT
eukprot:gene1972-33386_t